MIIGTQYFGTDPLSHFTADQELCLSPSWKSLDTIMGSYYQLKNKQQRRHTAYPPSEYAAIHNWAMVARLFWTLREQFRIRLWDRFEKTELWDKS